MFCMSWGELKHWQMEMSTSERPWKNLPFLHVFGWGRWGTSEDQKQSSWLISSTSVIETTSNQRRLLCAWPTVFESLVRVSKKPHQATKWPCSEHGKGGSWRKTEECAKPTWGFQSDLDVDQGGKVPENYPSNIGPFLQAGTFFAWTKHQISASVRAKLPHLCSA